MAQQNGMFTIRQYVFTVPRMLRPIFSRRRGLLGELCHIAERLLVHAYAAAKVEGRPGLILFVQTFGDLVTFNPHIHMLAVDGLSCADGVFVALPGIPAKLLERGFRRAPFSTYEWSESPWAGHRGGRWAATLT